MSNDQATPAEGVSTREVKEPTSADFDKLQLILNGFNNSHRHSNRLWAVCATMTILIISAGFGDDKIILFGSEFDRDYFIPIATITLSLANIAYCAAHSAAYRIGNVYHSLINESFSDAAVTSKYKWSDTAHRIVISNFNRIYPIAFKIEDVFGKDIYRAVKISSDTLFSSVPVIGIIFGVIDSFSWSSILILPFVLASLTGSFLLFLQIRNWARDII